MTEQLENEIIDNPEYELNHTDKLVGVFTEPGNTFKTISHFPAKTIDWILPLLLLIIVTIISTILIFSNPIIKNNMVEKQKANIQKLADNGTITQEQANTQKDMTERFMSGPLFYVIQGGAVFFGFLLIFFVVTAFYFMLIKFVMKGEGGYKNMLVAYSLPSYILVIQSILVVILSITSDKMAMGTNLAFFLGMDIKDFLGFLLSKVDPLSIWFYVVLGIASAKMFKSEETGKYIGMIIGVWLVGNIVLFFLAKSLPMLGGFIGTGA